MLVAESKILPDPPQFYGIFVAGGFTSPEVGCSVAMAFPSACPTGKTTPPVAAGSPPGQIQVANEVLSQGYMIAASGQANQATAGGVSNLPSGTALVSIRGNSDVSVTACNPCVTVGLTPEVIGHFAGVASPTQNSDSLGLVQWAQTGHSYPNPYGTTRGNNASQEFGVNFAVSVTPSGGGSPLTVSTGLC